MSFFFLFQICHTRRSSVILPPCQIYQVASAFLISPSWHGRLTENSSDCAVDGCGRPPRVVLAVYHIPAHLTQVVGFDQSFVRSTYNTLGLPRAVLDAVLSDYDRALVQWCIIESTLSQVHSRYRTGKRLYTSYLYQVPRYGIPKVNGPCARVRSFASTGPWKIPNF